ncbi:MAG: AAA family ATPase, partial [Chloroflexota bacterium]
MTHIIAISNEKGGVAKTTTTLSLGAALSEMGQRVLLIDLDAQANLTLALGLEPGENDRTSSNVLIEVMPLMSARRATDIERLDLIPSNSRIETAEQFLPVRTGFTTTLRRSIQAAGVNSQYDYVLM